MIYVTIICANLPQSFSLFLAYSPHNRMMSQSSVQTMAETCVDYMLKIMRSFVAGLQLLDQVLKKDAIQNAANGMLSIQ